MEKFLKSLFTTSDKKKNRLDGSSDEDRNDFNPPLDDRRRLSISKSGRMRQANKKRHSLSLDVYGETNKTVEKPTSLEYHVNPVHSSEPKTQRRRSEDPKLSEQAPEPRLKKNSEVRPEKDPEPKLENRRGSTDLTNVKTPEEEIDSAFEIIDKVL